MNKPSSLVESLLPVRLSTPAADTLSTDRQGGPSAIAPSDDGTKIADVCWVAREVYGAQNPEWQRFREWLLTRAPAWFRSLYIARGEATAAWLSNKPRAKAVVRRWMDRRITGLASR